MSEKEEYSAETLLSDLQQAQLIAYRAVRHPILNGNLAQHQTIERGQKVQKKQALQANSIKLSRRLKFCSLDETREEEGEE